MFSNKFKKYVKKPWVLSYQNWVISKILILQQWEYDLLLYIKFGANIPLLKQIVYT